jgi:intracellular septation protein
MTVRSKSHPYIRAIVDYGGVVAFISAFYLRLRFAPAVGGLGFQLAAGGHGARSLTDATWFFVIGSILSLLVGLIAERRIAPMPLIAGGLAVVFGAFTLIFHDPRIIMFKPTVINLIFALLLFGGLLWRRNPLKLLLGETLTLPDEAWRTLTLRYGLFFLAMAAANEIVRRTLSAELWLNFHTFGFPLLAVLFSFTQVPLMMKYMHVREPVPPPTE